MRLDLRRRRRFTEHAHGIDEIRPWHHFIRSDGGRFGSIGSGHPVQSRKQVLAAMNIPAENAQARWSEEQVRQFLRDQPSTYQNIKLPYGLETGGDDRSATCRAIFPPDLKGKSVLDIGSLTGYFCFEALHRGARAAVGIEVNPESIRQANQLAACLGLAAEFRLADFEKEPIAGSFDYVLCLNVLHHLKNPLAALDKLVALTREKLVLEVASIGLHDRHKLGLSAWRAFLLSRSPILYVERLEGKSGQKFFLTPQAIERLLLSHRKVFAAVEILPSEHKNRFLAVATKRRIRRLMVVAGPTSAGKTTLIDRWRGGDLPALEAHLQTGDPKGWRVVSANQLGQMREPVVDQLVLHYDFLRGLFKSSKTWERDENLDILDCADECTFVTVYASPEILRQQIEQSEIAPKTVGGKFAGNKRHSKIRPIYEQPATIQRFYQNWFDFCRSKGKRHYVVSLHGGLKIFSPEEWEKS